jgi:UDP-3-O-[3-hydroxymyristoyl] glucosamine N-acyltransferase
VIIGAHCNIARGTLNDTIIHSNVRIDALVHVGHNAQIGTGTIIVALSCIGGSCKIGKNCYIGEGARIKDHVTVGNQAIIAAGAVVIQNIKTRDIVAGVPAKSIKDKCNLSERERFSMVGY